jgi:hypothetical protein
MNKYNKNLLDVFSLNKLKISMIAGVVILFSACGGDGTNQGSTIELDTSSTLDLQCTNVGLGEEDCVLNDSNNPFRNSAVNDTTKWDLDQNITSAKSKFYLWATAQALSPRGENQYYTAVSLQELYTEGQSKNARDQAKLAYRSFLDNYYDSVSFSETDANVGFQIDKDFFVGDLGSNSANEFVYTSDPDFASVYQTTAPAAGDSASFTSEDGTCCKATAALGFRDFQAGVSFANYQKLVFKVKTTPTNILTVSFLNPTTEGGTSNYAKNINLDSGIFDAGLTGTVSDINGTNGWKQVEIDLTASLANPNVYNGFGLLGPSDSQTTILTTDVAFTGDAIGTGLVKDNDNDGFVYFKKANVGKVQFSYDLNNVVGENIIEPSGKLQLFQDKEEATEELGTWGYTYNEADNTITK